MHSTRYIYKHKYYVGRINENESACNDLQQTRNTFNAVNSKQTHEGETNDTDLLKQFKIDKTILTARRYSVLLHRAAEWIVSAWQHLAIHCPIHLGPIASLFFRNKTPTSSTPSSESHNHSLHVIRVNTFPRDAKMHKTVAITTST